MGTDHLTPFDSESGRAAQAIRQEKREAERASRRKRFVATIKGGEVRAAAVPADFVARIAMPTAGMMLARILNGELEPKSAKEAADIAKMAVDLAVTSNKLVIELGSEPTVPLNREKALEAVNEFKAELERRTRQYEKEPLEVEDVAVIDAITSAEGVETDEAAAHSFPVAEGGVRELRSVAGEAN